MDKEQAIDLLDNLIGMVEDNQDNDYDTALHMAIEALKQPEIIHCCECSSYGKSLSGKYMCLKHCTYPQTNYYCADGTRRVDDVD